MLEQIQTSYFEKGEEISKKKEEKRETADKRKQKQEVYPWSDAKRIARLFWDEGSNFDKISKNERESKEKQQIKEGNVSLEMQNELLSYSEKMINLKKNPQEEKKKGFQGRWQKGRLKKKRKRR